MTVELFRLLPDEVRRSEEYVNFFCNDIDGEEAIAFLDIRERVFYSGGFVFGLGAINVDGFLDALEKKLEQEGFGCDLFKLSTTLEKVGDVFLMRETDLRKVGVDPDQICSTRNENCLTPEETAARQQNDFIEAYFDYNGPA